MTNKQLKVKLFKAINGMMLGKVEQSEVTALYEQCLKKGIVPIKKGKKK